MLLLEAYQSSISQCEIIKKHVPGNVTKEYYSVKPLYRQQWAATDPIKERKTKTANKTTIRSIVIIFKQLHSNRW